MMERTDKERLDSLQDMLGSYTGKVICRWSTLARGWLLHETSKKDGYQNIREAIDKFLDANGR